MTPGWSFTAGFAIAALLGVGVALYQDAEAAKARIAHEAELAQARDSLGRTLRLVATQRTRLDTLELEAGRLRLVNRRLHAAMPRAITTVRPLLAAADSVTGRTEHVAALDSLVAATAACDEAWANCEARASLADSIAGELQAQLAATAALLDTTATKWRDAERRAGPSLFRDLWRSKGALVLLAVLLIVIR